MAKKKKQTPLQQIQKQLDKLAALHAKEEEIVEKIEEIIEEEEE
jgi:DNA-binding transcriptional regulator YhcF (GntR family)